MSGGHGVTVYMRNVRRRPPEWVKRHVAPSGWDRRHRRGEKGEVTNRPVPLFGSNEPYVNPDRWDRAIPGKRRRQARRAMRRHVGGA